MANPIAKLELQSLLWSHFDWERTQESGGDVGVFKENFINISRPAGSSHRSDIQEMAGAATRPFAVAYLSERLDEIKSIRGRTYFGEVGRKIDDILENYPGMQWWMEKGGLVIDTAAPDTSQLSEVDTSQLSEFDRMAGKLTFDGTQNGRLSADTIRQIADELDRAGFALAKNLQPAQWKPIAAYNQKYSRNAIKTFAMVASNPNFVRSVRRRLYVARERYQKAHRPNLP